MYAGSQKQYGRHSVLQAESPGLRLKWLSTLPDLPPLFRSQSEKLESRSHTGSVAHDGDGAERILRHAEINLYRLSQAQIALHDGTESLFADIEADPAGGPNPRPPSYSAGRPLT